MSPGFVPASCVVERRAELAGAHEVQVVGAGEAVDLLVTCHRLDVDGDEVAVEHGAICGLELGEALAQPVDPLVDIGVGDLGRAASSP